MARIRIPVIAAITALFAPLVFAASANAESGWWVAKDTPSPESEVNVTGQPFKGTDSNREVRGLIDAHTHMFMDLGMGGNAVCGSTFSKKGIADALKDCKNHKNSLLENLTNGAAEHGPLDAHDTTGYPTFKDWPTYSSLTHQQMYYKWVERAWRGGLRIMVNDMVSNPGLCPILGIIAGPNKYSCDDMDTVRREIKATYELQDFIDAQYGGKGKGWYRVVTSPDEARSVIEQGKLAVVIGIETSEPFGCKQVLGVPGCTKKDIDRGLDEMKSKGVSSMFLCHKFDNALCGVRYDADVTGLLVNVGQFITTGTWWNPAPCKAGEEPDNTVIGGVIPPELSVVPGLPAILPVYPKGPHCNPRGLTDLGEYSLHGMIKRNMIVEIDHMSAKSTSRVLDILEAEGYPGVVSSHSWLNHGFFERLYALGGFETQYGHKAEDYVSEWRATQPLRDKYGLGYGFGMDMNGFGGTPPPPGGSAKISYPFKSVDGGSTLTKQVTGERTWDYNNEGVSHYGMVPDWVASLTKLGGPQLANDLMNGAPSYLRTWDATVNYKKGDNLASKKKASASSFEGILGTFGPSRANDGKTNTRWASGKWADDQWWQVDLGGPRQVSKVTVNWEKAYGKHYLIQTSLDGKNWSTAAEVTNGKAGLVTTKFDKTSARFVRIQGVKRGTKYGYAIWEVNVYS